MTQLQALAKLHTDGVLSDQEFAAAKQRLLQGSPPTPMTQSPPVGAPAQSALERASSGIDPRVAALVLVGTVAFITGGGSPFLFRRNAGNGLLPVSPARNPPPSPDPIPIFPYGKVPIIMLRPGGLDGGRGTIGWLPQGTDKGQLQVNYHIDSPPGTEYVTDGLDVWVDGQYQHVKVMDLGGGDFSATIENVRPGSHVQISNYTAMQFPDKRMGSTEFDGTLIPLNGKAYVDPDKLNYLFNVDITPDDHNTGRAIQNGRALDNIGIPDTPEGRADVEKQLTDSILHYGYEPPAKTNEWGTFIKNNSIVYGPLGQFRATTTWMVEPDGSLRLTTMIPVGTWTTPHTQADVPPTTR
ncbi:hypothetical protein [Nocardia seriolae]|nr:hypothetical protein [Nocardia seriolae]